MIIQTVLLVVCLSIVLNGDGSVVQGLAYVSVEDDFANLCYNNRLGFVNVYRPQNRCEKLPYVRVEKREYLTHTFWCIIISNRNGNISSIEIGYDRGALFDTFLPSEYLIQYGTYDANVKRLLEMNSRYRTKFLYRIVKGDTALTNGFFPNTTIGKMISLKVDGTEICDASRINEPDPIFPNQEVVNSLRFYETCLRINRIRLTKQPNACEQLNEVNVLYAYYPVSRIKIWCITINPELSRERYQNNNIEVHVVMKGNTNFIEEHGNYDNDTRKLPYTVVYQDGSEFKITAIDQLTIAIQPKNANVTISGIQTLTVNGVDSCDEENTPLIATRIFNAFRNFTDRSSRPADKAWNAGIYNKSEADSVRYICSGTIIGPSAIICAAHCVHNFTNYINSMVILDRNDNTYSVSNITIHGNYNQYTFEYDAAILKLTQNITFDDSVEPICHANPKPQQLDPFDGLLHTITEWKTKPRNIFKSATQRDQSASDSFIQYFYTEINYCLNYRQHYGIHFVID